MIKRTYLHVGIGLSIVLLGGGLNAAPIALGDDQVLAVTTDGYVQAWGVNNYGQLGNSTWQNAAWPVFVKGLSNVVAVGGGEWYSVALCADQGVWVWGSGWLGTGTNITTNLPTVIPGFGNVTAIAAGGWHTLALKDDGTVWGWNDNYWGELGNGANTTPATPVQALIDGVSAIAAGSSHSLALRNDGTLWAWGYNSYGQLGIGTSASTNRPMPVSGLAGVVGMAGGNYFSLAVKGDGTVLGWGDNGYDQLGTEAVFETNLPIQVAGLAGIVAVAAGSDHALALDNAGQVWSWGRNLEGQLGQGIEDNVYELATPAKIAGLTDVVAIAAGGYTSMARQSDGTLLVWGDGFNGQLGSGVFGYQLLPEASATLTNIVAAGGSYTHLLAIDAAGAVWAVGANGSGQIGNGTNVTVYNPVRVANLPPVVQVSAGQYNSLARCADGAVWAWGSSQLQYAPSYSYMPFLVSNLAASSVCAGAHHDMVIRNDQVPMAWGYNIYGQLGIGSSAISTNLPTPLTGIPAAAGIAAGSWHSLILKPDGTVAACGNNRYGQLGDGTTNNASVPVAVLDLTDVIQVAAGLSSAALKRDGTVWMWGSWIMRPTIVSNLTDVTAIALGGYHYLALKSDGSLWAWGYNSSGQLGLGHTTYTNQPTRIASLTNVRSISAGEEWSSAVTADGRLWCWGSNSRGQLGNGQSTRQLTPLLVHDPETLAFGDFDGDRRIDPAAYLESGGDWQALLSAYGYGPVTAPGLGAPGYAPVPADYDGDLKSDPAVYSDWSGQWYVWLSGSGYAPASASLGGLNYQPVAGQGDYDGDRKADPSVYSGIASNWMTMLSAQGYHVASLAFPVGTALPVAGDFDGDRNADPSVYQQDSGTWYVFLSSTYQTLQAPKSLTPVSAQLGGAGYAPVPADYDGDGKTDPAVYQSVNGTWRARLSAVDYVEVGANWFGSNQHVALARDMDGDGLADPMIYHVANGVLQIMLSASGYGIVTVPL